jgi:hypothetical protein
VVERIIAVDFTNQSLSFLFLLFFIEFKQLDFLGMQYFYLLLHVEYRRMLSQLEWFFF